MVADQNLCGVLDPDCAVAETARALRTLLLSDDDSQSHPLFSGFVWA